MDQQERLRDEIHSGNQKLSYYLLGISGAALAFIVTQTKANTGLALSDIGWFLAAISFATSFVAGLLGEHHKPIALRWDFNRLELEKLVPRNLTYIDVETGEHRGVLQDVPSDDHEVIEGDIHSDPKAALKYVESKWKLVSKRISWLYQLQLYSLISGSIFTGAMATIVRFSWDVKIC